jgi:crotonobetainyl-CoA:carnitine CoA-transferase CaiB-like acyl-CoA transferase
VLDGLRILSLAEQYPGPYATLVLADLGAAVTLVERPPGGDPSRRTPAFFEALNRNKRSASLDLKHPDGRAALLRLAAASDVLLEGFRPGTMARLGLAPDAFAAANPRLVYVSISGFGQDGPYRDIPGHDLSYQALSGMLHRQQGNGTPSVPWLAIGNVAGGLFAAVGVLAALHARQESRTAEYVDVSLLDSLVSLMTVHLVPSINHTGPAYVPPEPAYGLFRTSDGKLLSLSIAGEDHFWASLCAITGLKRYAALTFPERIAQRAVLERRLQLALSKKTLAQWSDVLAAAKVPFSPVLGLDEVADDPQVRARGMLTEGGQGARRRVFVRQPVLVAGRSARPLLPAPEVGEHTRSSLASAGFTRAEIARLFAAGVAYETVPEASERAPAARRRRARLS